MHSLLQQEEPDDDLELLFAEDEEDAGFSDAGDASDVQMDSSSDEDEGPPVAGEEDLEGEKELQKAARAEKLKKRKMNDGMKKIYKKVRIDPTTLRQAPAPRPKKKSERASWLPTDSEAPIRASARGTTKKQKQELHAQMMDREIKRLKQLANMEKAAAAKEAAKKPAMTQEDRLAEAARVEKKNIKSLTRWEYAEQVREEEQRAKLAALKDRKMGGPVVTWWSGKGEWFGGKLKQVGKMVVEEKEKVVRKRKAAEMEEESESISKAGSVIPEGPFTADGEAPILEKTPEPPKEDSHPPEVVQPEQVVQPIPPPPIHRPPNSSVLAPPMGLPLTAPPFPHPYLAPPPSLDGTAPMPGLGYNPHSYPPQYPPPYTHQQFPNPFHQQLPPVELPPAPPAQEIAATTRLILQNFSEDAIASKEVQAQILLGPQIKSSVKPAKIPKTGKKQSLCAITGYPAKYKDPTTGLLYCNSFAYKEIQRLKRGEVRWSALVGAFVGLGPHIGQVGGVATLIGAETGKKDYVKAIVGARGVPDRFLGLQSGKEMDGKGKGKEIVID